MRIGDPGGSSTPKKVGQIIGKTVKKATKVINRSSGSRSGGSSGGYTKPRYSGSSNRSSGSSGGGSATPTKVTKPKPTAPGIGAYLGTDSAYQEVLRSGKLTLKDFLSDLARRRGESTTQFTTTKNNMERDRIQQLDDLRNEFASRGLIQSGLFGEEQGKFQQQFTTQQQALQQQQAALLADLLSQETNFKREQQLAQENARQQALQRRAAKYNIGG